MKTAIVLNCGERIKREICADKIICCDGGYNFCPVHPDVLLGDFDSLKKPERFDGVIVEHDPIKDAGDGELAVRYARETLKATDIIFYGVLGGRYDHTLCNFACMKLASDLGMTSKAEEDGLDIYFAAGSLTLATQEGETLSILPFGGSAVVSCTGKLFYPLRELLLTPSDTRGLSNISLGGDIKIDVQSGNVLVFHYTKR